MNATKRNPSAPLTSGETQPSKRDRASTASRVDSAASHASRKVDGETASPAETSSSVTAPISARLPAFGTYSPLTVTAPALTSRELNSGGYRVDISGLVTGFLSGVGAQVEQKPAEQNRPNDIRSTLDALPESVRGLVLRAVQCSGTTHGEQPLNDTQAGGDSGKIADPDDHKTKAVEKDKPNRFLDSDEHKSEVETLKRFWRDTADARKLAGTSSYRAFAEHHGFESYSTVSNCINGHMAMSLNVARLFANAFRVPLHDISPRWAAIVSSSTHPEQDGSLAQQINDIVRMLPRAKQVTVMQVASALLDEPPKRGEV